MPETSHLSEKQRIALLKRVFDTPDPKVEIGIGDDAATLHLKGSSQLFTTDCAVEGHHFECDFADWSTLGRRAVMAAASDIAAMAALPSAILSSLILKPEFGDADFEALIQGLKHASEELGVPIIGGNLSAGAQNSITTTLIGESSERVLRRSGAQPEEELYVSGPVGHAALGLEILKRKRDREPNFAAFVQAWRHPKPAFSICEELSQCASAAIDISDGLLRDLEHLCEASQVGAELEVAQLPDTQTFYASTAALDLDPYPLLLAGGEDYVVLFTSPDPERASRIGTRIGRITTSPSVRVIDEQGNEIKISSSGYDHFRTS